MRGLKNRLTRSNSLSSRRTVTHHCKVEPDQPDFVFIHRIRKSRLIDWQGSCSLGAGEMLFWIPLLRKRRSLSDSKLFCQILASTSAAGEYCMSLRIRQCVECPKCHTCYLIAFSPYGNGSYLVRAGAGAKEYILYCFCEEGTVPNRERWADVKPCAITKAVHDRGYGTLDEVSIRKASVSSWRDSGRQLRR